MKHPDESGNIQYYEVTRCDVMRYRLKAKWIRFRANIDGLAWYLRKLWREGD